MCIDDITAFLQADGMALFITYLFRKCSNKPGILQCLSTSLGIMSGPAAFPDLRWSHTIYFSIRIITGIIVKIIQVPWAYYTIIEIQFSTYFILSVGFYFHTAFGCTFIINFHGNVLIAAGTQIPNLLRELNEVRRFNFLNFHCFITVICSFTTVETAIKYFLFP